jgi:uncharacterized membrane protein YjfL (UPF0719 family)|tara:strand:- start:101 stop:331 length:231 start_codon:yes stop_codon:yes gene_type:complete
MNALGLEYLRIFGWSLVAAVSMSFTTGIFLLVYDKMTPQLDEWEELKKGNTAVAILMAGVCISYGIVVASVVHGST